MPAAEVDVTADVVRQLLAEQHADLGDLTLTLVANGWDNAIFRLGDELLVRLPRRQLAADLVVNEQRWLPELAPALPLPVPAPLRVGRPSATAGYPWSWSVCRWFDGDVAADVMLTDPAAEARRLGAFVAALHHPAPADAPGNPFRGQPIAELDARVRQNVAALGHERSGEVLARWDDLVETPPWNGPDVWLHGDLHSANVVVTDGSVSAVLDFGDLTASDPAVDLAIGWMLFDVPQRNAFRAAASAGPFPVDDATWRRGEAWALHFALLYLANSADNPRFTRMGDQLLGSVLDRS